MALTHRIGLFDRHAFLRDKPLGKLINGSPKMAIVLEDMQRLDELVLSTA